MSARFPMAVVVVGSPLTVTIEGASAVVAAEDFVGGLTTGNRVQAAFLGDRLTVIARAGGIARLAPQSWTAWTPVLTGTGWAAGNGTVEAAYKNIDGIVHIRARIIFGTTTTFGAGSPNISLPVSGFASLSQMVPIMLYNSGISFLMGRLVSGAIYVYQNTTGSADTFSATSPRTLAAGGYLSFNASYIAA